MVNVQIFGAAVDVLLIKFFFFLKLFSTIYLQLTFSNDVNICASNNSIKIFSALGKISN